MRRTRSWLALIVLVVPGVASPAPKQPTKIEGTDLYFVPREAPSEMRRFDFLLGAWACRGNPDLPTPHPQIERGRYAATLVFRSTLGGYWVQMDYKHLRSKDVPEWQVSRGMFHWKDRAKGFLGWVFEESSEVVMTGAFDAKGNWSATGTSQEEDGDHPYRESIVRKSDREIVYRTERQDEKGRWIVRFEDACKK
jgi:hypothetical protein